MKGPRAFIALAGFMMACGARADYLAYSVGEESRLPLPETIDAIEARYLVNLQWGDFDGARTRVAVLEVDNTSSATSFQAVGADGESVTWETQHANMVPVNGIEAIVTDVMNRSGRFRLVERQALSSILDEQDLVTAGRISAPSGAATGNVLGARFLVQAVVTDYEANVSGRSAGGLGGALTNRLPAVIGAVGVRSGLGRVGMNFRLIDAETSEIVYTKQIESVIRERGLMFGGLAFGGSGVLGGFFSNYARTPIGQAVIAGVNKGIYELVKNHRGGGRVGQRRQGRREPVVRQSRAGRCRGRGRAAHHIEGRGAHRSGNGDQPGFAGYGNRQRPRGQRAGAIQHRGAGVLDGQPEPRRPGRLHGPPAGHRVRRGLEPAVARG